MLNQVFNPYVVRWLWCWLPFVFVSLLPCLLAARWQDVLQLLFLCGLGVVLGFIRLTGKQQVWLCIFFLGLITAIGILGQTLAAHQWQGSVPSSLAKLLDHLREENVAGVATRTWQLSQPAQSFELSLEAKLLEGDLGWQWFGSNTRVTQELVMTTNEHFTRVSFITGLDSYVMRVYRFDRAIPNETFKAEVRLRSDDIIPAAGCRGIWLAVWNEGSGCLPVSLSADWQIFSHTWTTPAHTTSHVIRLILNDFDGLGLDIAEAKLYRQTSAGWQELEPLLPKVPVLQSSWDETWSGQPLKLTSQWQPYTFRFSKPESAMNNQFSATLLIPSEVTIATRNVKLSVLARAMSKDVRQSYVFGHPNLAGHVITVLTLLALTLTMRLPIQVLVTALGLIACYFTGSRSAWLVLLGATAIVLWLKQPFKRRHLAGFYVVALLGLLALWPYLGRLQVTGVENPSSRQDIWLTSLKIARDHLGLGIGTSPERFSELWYSHNPSARESVKHAHNMVLEWLVDFGVLGVVAIVWLLLGLLRLGWLRQGGVGVVIVLALITLNMADVSLFYTWVFAPLILYLNSSKPHV